MAEIGRDFVERHENEGAPGKPRMRDFKAGFVKNRIAIKQDVEIERAWAVERARGAFTAEGVLNGEQTVQQIVRREMRFQRDHGIREAGLRFESDGRGGVERGARGDAAKSGEAFSSGGERGLRRAGRAEKVGAEGDVGEGHACRENSGVSGASGVSGVSGVGLQAADEVRLILYHRTSENLHMDTLNAAGLGARRNEDIALDLLKFVAGVAGVGKPATPSTGFTGTAAPKPEEHVNQLLELYSRCLKAVEGKG